MVLIAACACSMVSISSHSTVCGSTSWLTISILLSDVRMEVSGAIVSCSYGDGSRKEREAGIH